MSSMKMRPSCTGLIELAISTSSCWLLPFGAGEGLGLVQALLSGQLLRPQPAAGVVLEIGALAAVREYECGEATIWRALKAA